MVAGSSYVVVRNDFFCRFAKFGNVSVKLRHIVFEQRVFHRHERVFSLNDVAGVCHDIVGVIHVQFKLSEVVYLEASFCLCHNCDC